MLLRLGQDRLGDYAAFTDESSISGHRYMVIGGISCRSAYAQRIHDKVQDIRNQSSFPSDSLQWKHFRPAKFRTYKKLANYFFRENDAKRIDFSCIIIDTSRLNHAAFNEGDGETFFQKIMYQLYVGLARKYGYPECIRGFHGRRESRYEMTEVKTIINAGICGEAHRRVTYRPLLQFEYMQVELSGPHQLADVLLGAVSYYWNAGMRRGGDSRKRMLAEYIQAECCATSLGRPTPPSMPHFDIWEMRLRGNPRA